MRRMVMLVVALIMLFGTSAAKYNSMDVEGKIYCPCGCGEILINCHCDTAVQTRSEIGKELLEGKTPEEIINKYVTLYGSSILVNQEKENIKSASKKNPQDMLPFYIIGIAITGFIAYNLGKSKRGGGKGGKRKSKEEKWEL